MHTFDDTLKIIQSCVCSLIEEFQSMPFNYFFEEDLRAILYSKLFNAFEKTDHRIELPASKWTKEYNSQRENKILVNPVKSEYAKHPDYRKNYGTRDFDIVILAHTTDEKDHYSLPCEVVIELSFSKESPQYQVGSHIEDILKLISYKNGRLNYLGLALSFDIFGIKNVDKFLSFYKQEFPLVEKVISDLEFCNKKVYALYIEPYQKGKAYLFERSV